MAMQPPAAGGPPPGPPQEAPEGAEGGGIVQLMGDIQKGLGMLGNAMQQAKGVPPQIVDKVAQVVEMYNSLLADVEGAAGGGASQGMSPENAGPGPASQPIG